MSGYKEALEKNEQLVDDLQNKRIHFAGIGTNKAKRRLNKLAKTDDIAKAVRLALEIEDLNIQAKKSYGEYIGRIYGKKADRLRDLIELFNFKKWIYGIQFKESLLTTHIVYFDLPKTGQVSWHCRLSEINDGKVKIPIYPGKWDGKVNSTLLKLEGITIELLEKL